MSAAPSMSVLYLVLEDFRGLSMSALCGTKSSAGRPCARTPHLDQLAREGVLFEKAYAQSPICNPSRTSAMTGRYPAVTGVLHNDAGTGRSALPTLPQLLQRSKRGRIVTTSPYSKVFHLPAAAASRDQQPWDRGWWNASNWRAVPAATMPWLGRNAPQPKRVMRGPGYGHVAEDIYHHMSFRRTEGILAALLAQPKPFFFGCGVSGTHTPLVPPMSFVRRYPASGVALPPRHEPHAPLLARKDGFQTNQLTPQQEREYIATYLAAAEYVDAQVGALLDLIARSSSAPPSSGGGGGAPSAGSAGRRLDGTSGASGTRGGEGVAGGGGLRRHEVAVVVHSDHGFHLGEHGRWSKYTLYEEAVRVPLIMKIPKGLANVRRPQLVELVDVLPTLLSLWGVPPAQRPTLDGRSLLPLAGFRERADGSLTPLGGSGQEMPQDYKARAVVRSAMRHPIRLPASSAGSSSSPGPTTGSAADTARGRAPDGGRWVCAEQHYVRTATAALTTYLYNGQVVNTTLFDLEKDPLEQNNLVAQSQAQWPYATLRMWARLVGAERDNWPREAVRSRDERAQAAGDICEEQTRRRRLNRKARRLRRLTRRLHATV